MAGTLFATQLPDRLSAKEIRDLKDNGSFGGGPVRQEDFEAFGIPPDPRMYYFFEWGLLAPTCGTPSPKVYAIALVSRDRTSEFCRIIWNPSKGT
jgi:hypothetical protein